MGLTSAALACLAMAWPWAPCSAEEALPASEQALQACRANPQVAVQSAPIDARDAETVCEGVERALQFLARAGLASPPATTVELVQQLPPELGDRALGCYLRNAGKIQLLTYRKFEAGGEWFQMQRDRELYRALAAHEMAHAVVGCHSEPRKLPVPAHEYVAYVVMFATMEPGLRGRLLARFSGTGFSSTLQINTLNHLANPSQFGVDAWRDYLRRPAREAWLRDVIAGRVVQEWPDDGP
ncbi:DUF6639 family protein [Hydrogenophaga sp.]|uniref:DUF6639 family protein n=1 Tax=Hydrogenophaga sp. TaxID=1904254 RepID=UPI0027300C20|nr:DUF6639 family protein [Hydrogenophaga sp.]MDP2075075.1 hypothetical protein [Hydrogenophaga sp.]MDP3109734.1 hypothetical protein [Hydrogenophaga sp.]